MSEPQSPTGYKIKLAATVIVVVTLLLIFEGISRAAYSFRAEISGLPGIARLMGLEEILDPYEMVSPNGYYHWVLRPGYATSAAQASVDKKRGGKTLGAAAFAADAAMGAGLAQGLRINSHGFRGPEIDQKKSDPRILMLGDSVTFGLSKTQYPVIVSESLAAKGVSAEVINGGVEGYSTLNLSFELPRYLELEPDIVTMFIGWNDLYSDAPWKSAWDENVYTIRVLKRLWLIAQNLTATAQTTTPRIYATADAVDANASAVTSLRSFRPAAVDRMHKIACEFHDAGAKVLIFTLPGLFTMDQVPTDKALRRGHLPRYTDNPYVLAALASSFNRTLTGLKTDCFDVVDLATWADDSYQPRDSYFLDSVHLTTDGLEMLGRHVADLLAGDHL